MKITLKVWRQKSGTTPGEFKTYSLNEVSEDMSFLEMFDVLNAIGSNGRRSDCIRS